MQCCFFNTLVAYKDFLVFIGTKMLLKRNSYFFCGIREMTKNPMKNNCYLKSFFLIIFVIKLNNKLKIHKIPKFTLYYTNIMCFYFVENLL